MTHKLTTEQLFALDKGETTYNEVMMWIEQGNEIAILN